MVLDMNITTNPIDYPDQQVAVSKAPNFDVRTSNLQNSMRNTSNFESLYVQEQQSKRQL